MTREEKTAWAYFWAMLLILAICTSCGTKRSFTSTQTVKDSTWVKKTVKPFDTLVKVPGNNVKVSANIDDLTEGKTFENSSKNLKGTLRREGNNIIAECNQEELEMIISLQKELLEVYRLRETEKSESETITKTPWYKEPLMWLIGIILLVLIIKDKR